MSYRATLRTMEAAERRQQREAQRRLRELERQAKEQAKLSAIEQARLEVETFENRLEVLLSVHKEQGQTWDWTGIAASLFPPLPQRGSRNEQKARVRDLVLRTRGKEASQVLIAQASLEDDKEFQEASQSYSEHVAALEKLKGLAR